MKRTNFWLLLLGTWSIAVLYSCNRDEIDPIDKFIGVYDQYTGFGPDKNGDFPLNGTAIVITKKTNTIVSMTMNGVAYGFDGKSKMFLFPECEIVNIDTTGLGRYGTKYARIVDKKSNIELCKIGDLILPINGIKGPDLVRIRLDINFIVEDSIRINLIGVKRKD